MNEVEKTIQNGILAQSSPQRCPNAKKCPTLSPSMFTKISQAQKAIIQTNRDDIIKYLRVDNALLNALQARHVLPDDVADTIRYTLTDADKNACLLDYIVEGSLEVLDTFLEILWQQNQGHVAALLTYDQMGKIINYDYDYDYDYNYDYYYYMQCTFHV